MGRPNGREAKPDPEDETRQLPPVSNETVEMIAHSEVELGCERLTDSDLIGSGGVGGATCDDSGTIHGGAEAVVDRARRCLQLRRARELVRAPTQGREGTDTFDGLKCLHL